MRTRNCRHRGGHRAGQLASFFSAQAARAGRAREEQLKSLKTSLLCVWPS